ncbi:MAG: type II 3-dehydroquinate dehydratase [Bacteroidetes bacterium]|nr:type II 3-dehydroquinate dehydratase [Bacteroidota bacterium]
MKLAIINGPNLNLLGTREPEIYGTKSFEDYFEELKGKFPDDQLEYYQSNSEGDLVDKIQEAGQNSDGIILNAGAYTHTSVAIADAVGAISAPVVEVHISNVFAREEFRHKSYISPFSRGVIVGLGLNGYQLAVESFKF